VCQQAVWHQISAAAQALTDPWTDRNFKTSCENAPSSHPDLTHVLAAAKLQTWFCLLEWHLLTDAGTTKPLYWMLLPPPFTLEVDTHRGCIRSANISGNAAAGAFSLLLQ